MISLWTAKVYLLRGVEALCLLSVFLFVGMILDWRIIGTPWQSHLWLGFISLFILVHHLVMSVPVFPRIYSGVHPQILCSFPL